MDFEELNRQKRGRLTVVSTGIRPGHITHEAITAMQRATKLLHFSEPDSGWVRNLRRPPRPSLAPSFVPGKDFHTMEGWPS
jgi:hypothetical protein